jgi:DNA-binding transcriptional LysR family regulator
VGQVRRVICASEEYLRRRGVPQTPDDVRAHQCIRHVGLAPRPEWQFHVGNRFVSVPITCTFTANDIDSSLNACLDGLGLGLFLSYMVAPKVKTGALRYVLEKFENEPVPVHVVYPHSKLLSNKVRLFVDECVDELRHQRLQ